jgi:hypothetical protein
VSSAILYLAIVAIWAVFLIPAWIKRPHGGSAGRLEADGDDAFAPEADADDEAVVAGRYDTGSDRVEFEESEFDPEYDSDYGPQYDGGHRYANEPGCADDGPPSRAGLSGAAPGGDPGYAYEYSEAGFADEGGYLDEARPPRRPRAAAAALPQSREQMLRARRRLLTILVGLTALTAAATAAGLVKWWICVPPVALLGLYLLLLREVAIADAENARRLAAQEAHAARAAHAAAARQRRQEQAAADARPGSRPAEQPGSRPTEATAEIIDISGRVCDQLYDQYADDEARAVGD